MTNARRKLVLSASKLLDLGLMMCACLVAAVAVVHQTHMVTVMQFFSMRVKIQNFAIFLVFGLIWHILHTTCGLYTSRRLSSPFREVVDVITAVSLGTLVLFGGAVLFHIRMVTPLFLIVFWFGNAVPAVCIRLTLRLLLAVVRKRGRNLRELVIVGTNGRALQFAAMLLSRPEVGYRVIGFVDSEWQGIEDFRRTGYKLVSDLSSFPQFLRNSVVDEVVMALPFRSMHDQASQIARLCHEQGIALRPLGDIFDLKVVSASPEELDGDSILAPWRHMEGWATLVKRIFDFTISAIALIVLSPLLLVTALLVRVTSAGQVLFIQKRVGLHKRQFDLYKFRTMVVDAEDRLCAMEHLNEVSGPVFKVKDDPRVTRMGRLLRRTSIDELPQLFNVLKGEMSLVGPRPLPVRDYKGFSDDWQRRRFSVKPGMTCLWQVCGRSSIPFERWMELDLQYIDRWSLWLDFRILFLTIPAVVRGSGAV